MLLLFDGTRIVNSMDKHALFYALKSKCTYRLLIVYTGNCLSVSAQGPFISGDTVELFLPFEGIHQLVIKNECLSTSLRPY